MSDVILQFKATGLEELATGVGKASQELTELSTAEKQVDASGKTLRQTLIGMREELGRLALAGKQNTDEYKRLRDEAGRLKDTIADVSQELSTAGSDTSGLDKALRATSVLVGGFTAVQGAAALFGDESEDLQKTLLKVNAAMSILNGLQAVQAELAKKDSIFTEAAAKAKALYARLTNQATVATKALTAALSIGLIGAIVLLVTNWDKLTSALDRNKKKLQELKNAQEELKISQDRQLQRLQAEENLLRLQGKNSDDISKRKIELARQFQQENSKLILDFQKQIKEIEKGQQALTAGSFGFRQSASSAAKQTTELKQRVDELQQSNFLLEGEIAGLTLSMRQQTEATKETTASTQQLNVATKELADSTEDAQRRRLSVREQIERENAALQTQIDLKRELGASAIGGIPAQNTTDSTEGAVSAVQKEEDKKREIAIKSAQLTADTITGIFATANQHQLENLNDKRRRGIITEKQYAREVAKLREKEARQAKVVAIFQAIINTAVAITKALGNPVQIALAAALGATQVALIASQKIPKFRHGVIDLKGEGTATSDSILARLSKGESVMTAQETMDHKDALMAMRQKDFDKKYVPIADLTTIISKRIPAYTPVSSERRPTPERQSNELAQVRQELQFIGQYIKQGNNIAAGSQSHLKDLITVRRGIYT